MVGSVRLSDWYIRQPESLASIESNFNSRSMISMRSIDSENQEGKDLCGASFFFLRLVYFAGIDTLVSDLLWSDPVEDETADGLTAEEMKEWYDVEFIENGERGCSYLYGHKATMEFLRNNRVDSIIRYA